MRTMTEQQILQKAIDTYGQQAQIEMLVEEASEVIQAVQKLKRAFESKVVGIEYNIKLKASNGHLMEELADLQIMLDQMYLIFPKEEIDEYREQKINRLKERIGL